MLSYDRPFTKEDYHLFYAIIAGIADRLKVDEEKAFEVFALADIADLLVTSPKFIHEQKPSELIEIAIEQYVRKRTFE